MTKQTKTTSTSKETTTATRPADYVPQQGYKATLSLADFTDDSLCAELHRRGYSGALRYTKVVNV